jgi:NAD(P)-dependent dehydrogenase (short-subunit alcohol dehydrogenase family)
VSGSTSVPGYGGVSGRSALVIGGSRGIGRAVTLALAEGGASVLAVGRDLNPLQELGAVARAHRLEIETARGDAVRPALVRKALKLAAGGQGAPDILVVAAGDYWEGPARRLTVERWEALARSNVSIPLLAMQEALPGMRRRRYGRILLFGVAGGDAPRPAGHAHAYRAAKLALLTLAKTFAQEEARHGITVNTILPGVIRTGRPTPRESALLERVPAGRPGSAREVARAALFLLAEESGYITGAALPVSGGFLI